MEANRIAPGGLVAFHDYYPGVKAAVHEVLATGRYRRLERVRSLTVLEKLPPAGPEHQAAPEISQGDAAQPAPIPTPVVAHERPTVAAEGHTRPLVSCIMPTRNRIAFVSRAIAFFCARTTPRAS